MLAKTPIFDRFINFCREQGNREFDHSDCNNCALAQFGKYEEPVGSLVIAGYRGYTARRPDGSVVDVDNILPESGFGCLPYLYKCHTFADVVAAVFVEA